MISKVVSKLDKVSCRLRYFGERRIYGLVLPVNKQLRKFLKALLNLILVKLLLSYVYILLELNNGDHNPFEVFYNLLACHFVDSLTEFLLFIVHLNCYLLYTLAICVSLLNKISYLLQTILTILSLL